MVCFLSLSVLSIRETLNINQKATYVKLHCFDGVYSFPLSIKYQANCKHNWKSYICEFSLFWRRFSFRFSIKYQGSTGRWTSRSAADAIGQYVDRGGRGRSREGWRFVCSRQRDGRGVRGTRAARQRDRTLRLQGQTRTDTTDISHRIRKIWTGKLVGYLTILGQEKNIVCFL